MFPRIERMGTVRCIYTWTVFSWHSFVGQTC